MKPFCLSLYTGDVCCQSINVGVDGVIILIYGTEHSHRINQSLCSVAMLASCVIFQIDMVVQGILCHPIEIYNHIRIIIFCIIFK